jgi:hypothetical protein
VLIGAVFSVLTFTGLFDLVETRFYNPSITNSLIRETEQVADSIQDFLDELQGHFSASLTADAVKRSFLPNQTDQDIFERTRVFGILLESIKGLQSVRFVDTGGIRIHFSTNSSDIIFRTNETISYKDYNETTPYVPYSELAVNPEEKYKIVLDQQNERIMYAFPFYDSLEIYRGTAFFSLSVRTLADRLISMGRIKIGENLSIVSVPPGIVLGLPRVYNESETIIPYISAVWQEGHFSLSTLDSAASGSALVLISAKTSQNFFVGQVVSESLFAFPQSMKLILLAACFLTVFLSIFLIFNLHPDTITHVQNRLKKLQISLIQEYYERKGEMDWNHWRRELEQRRDDVRVELKRGIRNMPAALQEDVDSLIDKSWNEILNAIGGKRETQTAIDEDKLQSILNRVLRAPANSPPTLLRGETEDVLEELAVEPEELEDLEELEGPEEPEKIQFASINNNKIEIVSPFAGINSRFNDQVNLEELHTGYSMSLVYKPFQNEDKSEPQELQSVDPEQGGSQRRNVIRQKNGLNYVDQKAKTPDSETAKSLDPGLKTLVDSVIGKNF